jgi:hypothetical protein
MEERERRQGYDLNGNLILSKVGEGIFIVREEKEPFEAGFLRPAGAKSAVPAAEPDRPAHSPARPDLHWTSRHTGQRHRTYTEQVGEGERHAEDECRVGQLLRWPRTEPHICTPNR